MMALIAWASDAGPASARQGSRSARPAPPACGRDRLPTSRRFAAKRSWLVVSASAHFANQLRIAASWSDVAWTSVVLWISQACHSRAMARSHKPCRRHALTETSFDDLDDYVPTRDHPRQRETRRASATWTVTDDWPKDVPVTDSPRPGPAHRGGRERGSHHGIEKRAPAHACRGVQRKIGRFWSAQFCTEVAHPTRFERVTFAFGAI